MPIKIGDRIPDATLFESTEFGDACPLPPSQVSVEKESRSKRVVMFGLPGAYTPTCSAKHVPGYFDHYEEFKAKGIDEIWCLSVNDGYVMAEWGREQAVEGKIRMLGDGTGELAKKLGLDVVLPGMGLRMKRFSMLVEDGIVKQFNLEQPGKFEVSNAETILKQIS